MPPNRSGRTNSAPDRFPSGPAASPLDLDVNERDTLLRPTTILMREHRVIERVLLCLDRMATRAREQGDLDLDDARSVIAFLQEFADQCHHGKEEQRLFPTLEHCGLPRDAGPTAVMRAEHEMGREHVRGMDAAVVDAAASAGPARDRFVAHAFDFVLLLREHIAKEDQVLFPMADRMLDAGTQKQLLAEFAAMEQHDVAAGTHERFLSLADRLCERYGVTAEDAEAQRGGCGHSCG